MNRIQVSQIGYVLQISKLNKVALHSPFNLLCIRVSQVTYILVNVTIFYPGTKSPNVRSILNYSNFLHLHMYSISKSYHLSLQNEA